MEIGENPMPARAPGADGAEVGTGPRNARRYGGRPMARPEQATETASPHEEHVVIFRLAEELYAIDIQSVQEIVRMQAITPVPGVDVWVEGITNLRGRVVPVIDLRRRCGITATAAGAESRIVVVNAEHGTLGLIVDAVVEVLRIPEAQIEQPGAIVAAPGKGYLRGIAKLDDRLVSLMDLEGVLPGEDDAVYDERELATDDAA